MLPQLSSGKIVAAMILKTGHEILFLNVARVTKMMDDTPYLIVDNLKLAPVRRISRIGATAYDRPHPPEQPMGIVDRVTISDEARKRAAQMAVDGRVLPETDSFLPVPCSTIRSQHSLLTYSRNLRK